MILSLVIGSRIEELEGDLSSLGDSGEGDMEDCGAVKMFDELCLGDSEMEYNFLTLPSKKFLETNVDPCKLLVEPFR